MRKPVLGRGLGTLLEDVRLDEEIIREIEVGKIIPNPYQPRTHFDEGKLEELAASIKEKGVLQPVVLRLSGSNYELVAGERRWRAAKMAGMSRIPAIIRDLNNRDMLKICLIENIQRQNLNPIEEARAYKLLISEFNLVQEDVAKQVGKDRSTVTNMLRLLNLPLEVQKLLEEEKLSMGHARALLGIDNPVLRIEIAKRIIARDLSVREVEKTIQRIKKRNVSRETSKVFSQDPLIVSYEERLMRSLGTKVKIHPAKKDRGRIEIDYYSLEDFDRIFERLQGEEID
ncbi:ParB/RepB/Spo0J family partition protein [bacterium]|nr:ParB/RepB/Spo0J family partition protein [bacterium]